MPRGIDSTDPSGKPPILPAIILAASSIAYPYFEYLSIQYFDAGRGNDYDWKIESLSDLGVDYRQVHPLKHHNVASHRHQIANLNFTQVGIVFALAQFHLLYTTRQMTSRRGASLRTIRFLLSAMFGVGMVLFSQIHGGPREKHWGIIGWHWSGMTMAAIAGNLNSVCSAVAPTVGAFERDGVYRLVSTALGWVGLYGIYRFNTLGDWNSETQIGLWQRCALYPVIVWSFMTALELVGAQFQRGEKRKAA